MPQRGIREDRKKIDEAVRNRKINLSVGINFPALPRFLTYLEASGITDSLAEIEVNKQRKCWEHMEVFPLIYLCKILVGIESTRGTREVLANKAAMTLLGFSDEQLEKGLTGRGKANQYGKDYERQAQIVSEPTIVDNIAAYDHREIISTVFDAYIRWLAGQKQLELGDTYILDSTLVETPADYPGSAMTKREEEDEDGNIQEKTIHGFKVFVLMDAKTKIPVALEIVTAEKADCNYLYSLLKKGIANVGPERIRLLLADRGFIDGDQMWRIKHQLGVDFVIPARKSMDIWADVVSLRQSQSDRVVMWPYGKKGQSGGYLVAGAVSYGQYAETPAGNRKYASGDPLTAVVITHWRDKPVGAGKEKVLLTTLATDDALIVMKSYRLRTLIENCGFREMKQAAYLSRLPQRKGEQAELSAYAHMTLCVLAFAAFIGFLGWDEQRARQAKEKYSAGSQNLRDYRVANRSNEGYIFIFYQGFYAVYETKELLAMMGMTFER